MRGRREKKAAPIYSSQTCSFESMERCDNVKKVKYLAMGKSLEIIIQKQIVSPR